jgi:hypothetical protein
MTINEMMAVIDDLKPQIIEEFALMDLHCDLEEIEGEKTFYKLLTIITVEQGMFSAPIFISIDISKTFVKKVIETHIKHLLCDVRKGAGDE